MLFRQLFDRQTSTYTYLLGDGEGGEAVLVDTVLEQVERDLKLIQELGLTLRYCLETHVHADHITGAGQLRELTGCLNLVPQGARVSCANGYLADGDILRLGKMEIQAIATPGHTDSHLAYWINQTHLLTGDALLIRGCGRTDFQSGDAGSLYDGVTQRLFNLPPHTWVYPGHDYRGHTISTIQEEKLYNPRFLGRTREEFIAFMASLHLPSPQKRMEAVPANEGCGQIPASPHS